jgi:FkbM family methyltransferase
MDPVSTTRRWIHALKDEAARLLAGRRGLSRTVNGMTFRVHPDTRARFAGAYDPGAGRALAERVRPGQEVWNVGANVGVYVLQLGELVGPSGHVVAFEPAPAAADLLWRNVVLNGFTDRVTLIRAAVGEEQGETQFFVDGASPMGRAGQANPLLERTAAVRVPAVTLDQVALDIEGFEVGALRAATSILTGKGSVRPWLIVELHPDAWSWSGHNRDQLQQVIEAAHLRVVPLSGQRDPLGEYGQVLIEPTA